MHFAYTGVNMKKSPIKGIFYRFINKFDGIYPAILLP